MYDNVNIEIYKTFVVILRHFVIPFFYEVMLLFYLMITHINAGSDSKVYIKHEIGNEGKILRTKSTRA